MFASVLWIFLPTYSMTSTDASGLYQTDQTLNSLSEVLQLPAEKHGTKVPLPYSFSPKGNTVSDLLHKQQCNTALGTKLTLKNQQTFRTDLSKSLRSNAPCRPLHYLTLL